MMNNINEFKMNGKQIKLVTPIQLRTQHNWAGDTVYQVLYTDEQGEIYWLGLNWVLGLRSYQSVNPMREDRFIPEEGVVRNELLINQNPADLNTLDGAQQNRLIRDVNQIFHGEEYNGRKSPEGLFDFRQDRDEVPYTNPARSLPYTIRPNPHIDKDLLTKEELAEVILWALEVSNYDGWPLTAAPVDTSPNSAISHLAAYLGTLVYGPNNYIGPHKTGDIGKVSIEEAVTTVPALSEADARARAHDIGLSVTDNSAVDQILPPLGQAAQVFRPAFEMNNNQRVEDRSVLTRSIYDLAKAARAPTRTGATNHSLLKLAGDVEENPGPPKKYSAESAAEEAALYGNPMVYSERFNHVLPAVGDWSRTWYNSNNAIFMRGARDDQTDFFWADDGICQFTGWSWDNVTSVGNRACVSPGKIFVYSATADVCKEKDMAPGALGSALNGTLMAFNDLLALQRTSTNTMDGNPELNIFVRTPKTDFGCFLPMVKALLYEFLRAPITGGWELDWCPNVVRKRGDNGLTVPTEVYPNTINDIPANVTINSWAITSKTLAALLLNNITPANLPAGWPGLDNNDTAYVVVSDELQPAVASYITLMHLEYPFTSGTLIPDVDSMDPTAFRRQVGANGSYDWRSTNLISGPKRSVVYILASESDVPNFVVDDGAGNETTITIWNDITIAAPPATDIMAPLFAYAVNHLIGGNGSKWTPDFMSACHYFFRFMDVSDWRAALSITGTIMSTVGNFQRLGWMDTIANSSYFIVNYTNPVTAAQVANFQSWNINAGLQTSFTNNLKSWYPKWNDRAMFAKPSNNTAPGNPRITGSPDAYIQDTPWLTKYGIYKKYFAKNVVAPKDVDTYTKLGSWTVFYTVLAGTRHRAEMLHNLIQSKGIVNRDLFLRDPQVIGKQQAIWRDIDKVVSSYDKMLAGWNFVRVTQRQPLLAQPAIPAGVPQFSGASWDWWFDSPVYLYNPMMNVTDDAIGLYPVSSTGVVPSKICANWQPNSSASIPIYGTNTGGPLAISLQPDFEKNGTHPQNGRALWSMIKMINFNNPAPNVALTSFFLLRQRSNNRNPLFDRPVISSTWTAYLRWISSSSLQELPIANCRHMIVTMPHYPRSIDLLSGQQLAICAVNAGAINSVIGSIDLKGSGSASYITLDLPGVDAYDFGDEYSSMLSPAKPAAGQPPADDALKT